MSKNTKAKRKSKTNFCGSQHKNGISVEEEEQDDGGDEEERISLEIYILTYVY